MWFLTLAFSLAVLWLLYVIAKNTGESLDKQEQLLQELRQLNTNLLAAPKRSIDKNQTIENPSISKPVITQNSNSNTRDTELDSKLSESININQATINELQTLPGIGKAVAQKIIDSRPFSSLDALGEVSGISKDLLGKIKNKIAI